MKKNVSIIFCFVLYIAGLLVLILPAISDLNNKEDVHTVNLSVVGELMVLEHSINGLVPTGKDYYYVGLESETNDAYIIHAPKSWFKKNFNQDMWAKDINGVTVTGLLKEPSKYAITRELKSVTEQLKDVEFPYGINQVLEISYRSRAIIRLILFGVTLFLGVAGIYIHKNKSKMNVMFVYVHFILCFITLCFDAYYMR